MEFHCQNVQTGERLTLDPTRTLVGAADYAAVRTAADGPYLAALLVRYPAGWAVHGLSDDPQVRFNHHPLTVGRRVAPRAGDLLRVGADRFRFDGKAGGEPPRPPSAADRPPAFVAYVRDPDGTEECRVVDHDLLIGRLPVCHVRFADSRLSRVTALLTAHAGAWYVHALAKKPIVARNRRLVPGFARLEDGDELVIGPLSVRVELGSGPPPESPARFDSLGTTPLPRQADVTGGIDTDTPEPTTVADPSLRAAGLRLDQWLQSHSPGRPSGAGVGGWLAAQRDRLSRFWFDTPEASAARGLRAAGRMEDAFAALDRAVRASPDSPALLRELYRLYEAAGLTELCFRPLRQIEKLAAARGTEDAWVLEALARLCERLGRNDPALFDRAIRYWDRLEAATGVSYARERAAGMANRTLREGGFAGTTDDGT